MSLKISDVIPTFDGQGDFGEWIQKVELVAELQEVKNLTSFIPLFLTGGAFSVYQGLEKDVRSDYVKVKQALLSAFSADGFCAYDEFTHRHLRPNETVDVFLADLRRLAMLIDPSMSDRILKCAFVSGLPEGVRLQMRAACSLETMTLAELVERSRMLLRTSDTCMAAAMRQEHGQMVQGQNVEWQRTHGQKTEGQRVQGQRAQGQRAQGQRAQLRCYNCQGIGHFSKDCQQMSQTRERSSSTRRCFVCGDENHIASSCPKRFSGAKNE